MLASRYVSRNGMSLRKRLSFKRVWHFNTSAVLSDGELSGGGVGDCGSNASLPSVQAHRRHAERSVASWAVCFERLLQDPLGVRYFSEFLKKEFSEENILFWQACEVFSHVPENDKKQLTQQAREIYSSFLSSKATTPVNIDSQAQLADDILNAPRPHMFKEQQLQIFNLMKFDSYTRFLKSRLYQECMLAEVESRPLPEPHHVPASPNSKSSSTTGSSERSTLATSKKQDDKKTKSGRSLNEDRPEDHADRQKKGMFFSWSRNRSFGKGPKKRDLTDFNYSELTSSGYNQTERWMEGWMDGRKDDFSGSNGRRESQGSLSSGASLELGTSSKNEGDRSVPAEKERGGGVGAPLRQCNISLPDGSCCSVPVRTGVSIRELLQGLCEKLCINLAAVDLFLVGGEKPLVLDQDCITLCSRDLRLEKRTLFRLDLVPINRSVGLKAKPTKPVTEVLRPVVAKYGLHLADLVARISGEKEPLDLGLPISNLDGLRVVLDVADHCPGNDAQKAAAASKSNAPPSTSTRNQPATGEDRRSGKPSAVRPRGENGKAGRPVPAAGRSTRPLSNQLPVPHHKGPDKRAQAKIKIDEAEEFFDLISKAQSNRADDQRGLLNKSDLQLPEFLRLSPPATDQAPPPYGHKPTCSTPHSRRPDDSDFPGNNRRGNHKESGGQDQEGGCPSHYSNANHQSQSSYSSLGGGVRGGGGRPRPPPPFPGTFSPVHPPPAGEHARGFPASQDGSKGEGLQMLEEDALSDLTLVGEGEISSPHLTPLPPSQQHDRWPSSGTSPV